MVDAGGFARGIGDISKLQTEYLLKGLSMMGYSVFNLGARDLNNGGMFIKILRRKYDLDFLSANIYYKETSRRFSEPYVIKRIKARSKDKKLPFKKLSIGIVGLCDERSTLFSSRIQEKMLEAKDPVEIARVVIPQVRKKVDLLILLYHGKYPSLQKILKEVNGVDVVVLGGSYSFRETNDDKLPIIVTTPSMGKYAGTLTLELNKKKRIISHRLQKIALNESIADDPVFTRLVKEFEKVSKEVRRKATKVNAKTRSK